MGWRRGKSKDAANASAPAWTAFQSLGGTTFRMGCFRKQSRRTKTIGTDPWPVRSTNLFPLKKAPKYRSSPFFTAPLTVIQFVSFSAEFNLLLAPFRCPLNPATCDPVVGLALEAPVSNGWMKGNCFTIKGQFPIPRRKGCHYLIAAATATFMDSRSIFYRNVQNTTVKRFGHRFDEFMRQLHHSSAC